MIREVYIRVAAATLNVTIAFLGFPVLMYTGLQARNRGTTVRMERLWIVVDSCAQREAIGQCASDDFRHTTPG